LLAPMRSAPAAIMARAVRPSRTPPLALNLAPAACAILASSSTSSMVAPDAIPHRAEAEATTKEACVIRQLGVERLQTPRTCLVCLPPVEKPVEVLTKSAPAEMASDVA